MAFNLKWSVIFTLAMVGQLLNFGSAMPQSAVFEGEDLEAAPLEAVTSPSEGEDLETVPLLEMLERTFERLDENGNNFISKREFFQGVESLNEDTNDPKELSRNTLNLLFNDLDKNNDGQLDIEEFKKLWLSGARRALSLTTVLIGGLLMKAIAFSIAIPYAYLSTS